MSRFLSKGVFLLSFILYACTQPQVTYHSFQSVDTNDWNPKDSLFFNVPIEQGGKLLVEIELRHLANYPYTNVPLSVSYNLNDSTNFITDSISIEVADNEGHWKGVGLGAIFQKTDTLLLQKGQKPGNYIFKITHLIQEEPALGIHDIGIKLSVLESPNTRSINTQKDEK